MNNKEKVPMEHNRIRQLIAHERVAGYGYDDFHTSAVQIIEQLLGEVADIDRTSPEITDASEPLSAAERETVLDPKGYRFGALSSTHHNWISRMDATVQNRDEIIEQLKQKCPDCDDGKAKDTGGYSPGCLKCDGSGRRIVSQMLDAATEATKQSNFQTREANRQLLRIRQGLLAVGMRVVEQGEGYGSKIVVLLCPPEASKL